MFAFLALRRIQTSRYTKKKIANVVGVGPHKKHIGVQIPQTLWDMERAVRPYFFRERTHLYI